MAISFSKSSEKTFFPVLSPLTKVISFSSIDLSKQVMNWAKIVAVCLQKFLFPQFCLPKSTTHKLHYSVKKNAANSNKKVDDR